MQSSTYTIAADRLFDGREIREEPCAIVVRRGSIAEVRSRETSEPLGPGTLDAREGTVLPGLVNCHVHIARGGMFTDTEPFSVPQVAHNFRQTLAAGVTTVGEMGCAPHLVRWLRRATALVDGAGPSLVAVGPMVTVPGGYPLDWMSPFARRLGVAVGCGSEAEARAAVRRLVDLGLDGVKLTVMHQSYAGTPLPTFDSALARVVVEEAHGHGLPVYAHAHSGADYDVSLAAGADALMHSAFDALDDETLRRVVDSGVPLCPTLWVFESIHRGMDERWDEEPRYERTVTPRVRAEWRRFRRAYEAAGPVMPPGIAGGLEKGLAREGARTATENFARLVDAGVPIAFGNDAAYGFSVLGRPWDELGAMERAGLDRIGCLRAATSGSARLLGLADRGRIAPGLRADLVVVDGRPDEDLAALEQVRLVVRRGRPFFPSALDRPAHAAALTAATGAGLLSTLAHALTPP